MTWDLKSNQPIYTQLLEIIQIKIISGYYPPGTKLPSVRDLAAEASVNPNTMQKALAELEQTGLIFSQRTAGRFITEDTNLIKLLRKKIASEQIQDFFSRMKFLGFSHEEILDFINNIAKEAAV